MKITIENLQEAMEFTGEMEELLKNVVECSLELEEFDMDPEVSFLIVDNEKIREMNLEYRGKDKPTDVLSFPMIEMEDGKLKPVLADYDMDEELLLLGDIVISVEMAGIQAEEYGHSFMRELAFLATHGMFHLIGYDHETEEEEKEMMGKQEAVLEKLGLKRA